MKRLILLVAVLPFFGCSRYYNTAWNHGYAYGRDRGILETEKMCERERTKWLEEHYRLMICTDELQECNRRLGADDDQMRKEAPKNTPKPKTLKNNEFDPFYYLPEIPAISPTENPCGQKKAE